MAVKYKKKKKTSAKAMGMRVLCVVIVLLLLVPGLISLLDLGSYQQPQATQQQVQSHNPFAR